MCSFILSLWISLTSPWQSDLEIICKIAEEEEGGPAATGQKIAGQVEVADASAGIPRSSVPANQLSGSSEDFRSVADHGSGSGRELMSIYNLFSCFIEAFALSSVCYRYFKMADFLPFGCQSFC